MRTWLNYCIRQGVVSLCLAAGALVACGGGDNNSSSNLSISSQPLTGKVGGLSWTLGTAQSDSALSDADGYFVDMYSDSLAACTGSGMSSAGSSLIAILPTAAGDYPLGMNQTVTFYLSATGDNLVATSGKIHIDAVTSTTISGGLRATYDANNDVDGQFQATICP